MLGKGLESLIPKKSGDNQNPPKDFSTSKESFMSDSSLRRGEALGGEASLVPEGVASRERRSASAAGAEERPVLSGGATKRSQESIFHIEVEKIKPNPYQPRRNFNEKDLAELAQSIREFGIIQPLVVTKTEKDSPGGTDVEYQLVAGERRLLAAKLIGIPRVPAVVKRFDFEKAKLEVALVENIQRSNLNPVEAARAYVRLREEFGLTQKEIAVRIGKSRETVANTVRLLNLPASMQTAILESRINESQAKVILAAQNPLRQNELFEKFLGGKSVSYVKKTDSVDPEAEYWQKRLEERLGAPVDVKRRQGKGRVTVKFHSEAEWQNILDKILGEEVSG